MKEQCNFIQYIAYRVKLELRQKKHTVFTRFVPIQLLPIPGTKIDINQLNS